MNLPEFITANYDYEGLKNNEMILNVLKFIYD